MAKYKNPVHAQNFANTDSCGDVVVNPFVFDLANPAYKPTAVAVADLIQIGIVPAGCVLLPHLSLVRIPALDTNGAPLGQCSIGTEAVPTALKAAGIVSAAQALFGEDFTLTTGPIGSKTVDTPIYLAFTVAIVTLQTVGKIYADLAIRAWDTPVDG